MGVVGTVLAFVLVLVVLVLVHELGHFVVAKLAGITVQEFGIGFPPRIGSVVWRGTRYSLNWIPLGGFVKMLGEDGEIEAEKMRQRGLSDAAVERAMEGAFNRKPIAIRIIVLVAGVAMNFLLAVILFAAASSLPMPNQIPPLTVTGVQPGSPAATKLRVGDKITAADGQTFDLARRLTAYVSSNAGNEVMLTIERAGRILTVAVTPRELTDAERERGVGPVGFSWSAQPAPPAASNPVEAVAQGAQLATTIAIQIPAALGQTVMGLIGLAPNTGDARGPIGIAQATGEVLQEALVFQLFFVGLLSVNLAVLNILPFPPLDGGRVAVVVIEAVRRRRLPAEREALIYITGFLVLIALVILISIQDIARVTGS